MKTSKKKVIILSVIAFLLVSFIGAVFYASSLVKPEEIKKIAVDGIQKTFPNAKVEMGDLDLSLGTSISLELESLDLKLKKGKNKDLMSVKDVDIKIPIWAIIFGGGSIKIEMTSPQISYSEINRTNNWKLAQGTKKTSTKSRRVDTAPKTKSSVSEEGSATSLAVPAFLAASKVNLIFKDTKVNYKLKDNSKGSVLISRFIVKDLGLKSDSAFEVSSKLSFLMANKEKFDVDALIIGEFNFKEFLATEALKTHIVLKLTDFSYSGLKGKIPNITSTMNVNLNKGNKINGDLDLKFLDKNRIKGDFSLKNGMTTLDNLLVEVSPEDLAKIVAFSDPNISLRKSNLKLDGSVIISKNQKITPRLNLNLNPGVTLKQNGVDINSTVEGSFRGKKLDITARNKLFDGYVDTNINLIIDVNKKEFDVFKLPPYLVRVSAKDINLNKEFIQKSLYPEKKKNEANTSKPTKTSNKKTAQAATAPKLPKGRITLDLSNIKVDQETLNLKGTVLTTTNSLKSDEIKFAFSDGNGALKFDSKLLKNKTLSNIDFKVTQLNLSGFRPFLPPKLLKDISGSFSGSVNGSINSSKNKLFHNLSANITAKNGELKGVDISESINGVLSKIPVVKDKVKKGKSFDINEKFERLVFKAQLKENHYKVSSFQFVGINNKAQISGNGNIYPLSKTKKGVLDFKVLDNAGKIRPILEKEVGVKELPMRMTGYGLALKPDYKYTTKVLVKKGSKTQAKKAVKKQLNKLFKGKNNKKVNKLLKGLFK